MIEVSELSKKYGAKTAVSKVSFKVEKGEVVGFLGPNGAGKTTTMNMITGFISSNGGTVKIDGLDILDDADKVRSKIGYLPEQPPLYQSMTVDEYLRFVYGLKKVKLPKNEHLNEICQMTGLTEVRNKLIANLSKGYKQRVGIAQALTGNPEVLILDEPTVGLDPLQIIEIRNVIKKLAENSTVILSSHILSEVQAICGRIIVINNGKIIADDTPDNLSKTITGGNKLIIKIKGDESHAIKLISAVEGVNSVKTDEETKKNSGTISLIVGINENSTAKNEILAALAKANIQIVKFEEFSMSLEEIFLKLTAEQSQTDEQTKTKPKRKFWERIKKSKNKDDSPKAEENAGNSENIVENNEESETKNEEISDKDGDNQ